MAGSPFSRGGAATKTAAPAAAPRASKAEDDPTKADVTNLGDSGPIGGKGDPFAASDPTGISGYKPIAFMGQLVLIHPTETGDMTTTANNAANPTSEYVRFDIIPLTAPEPGNLTRNPAILNDEGLVAVMNKDGEVETFEAYAPGERIDDVLVFNKPLVREGRKALDNGTGWILGRIELGAKKQGQSPPVIIVAGDDEDKAIYQEWRKAAQAAAR